MLYARMMGRGRAKAKQQRAGAVVVPDLLGLTALEAGQVGMRVGLLVVGPEPDFPLLGDLPFASLSDLQGTVIRQRPEAGAAFERHAQVMVWTSGPGGEAGVREPRRPFPPVRENRAAVDLEEDEAL
jgi:hypothetical protein